MIQLGRFDELGSGITAICKYLPLYTKSRKPAFRKPCTLLSCPLGRVLSQQGRMAGTQPRPDLSGERLGETDQFIGVTLRRRTGHVVLDRVPLDPAGIEIGRIGLLPLTQNQRQRLERPVMGEVLVRAIPLRDQQDRAQLERRVVSDAEPPVRGNLRRLRVGQVTPDNREEISDFLRRRAVLFEPAVLFPFL